MAYPPQTQCEHQLQRILESATFRNAHTLQQLLQFLVTQASDPDTDTLKEYTIGVKALSRPEDFDPKVDPIVRVQTHRLRQKLRDYYDHEGRQDPILIGIPKGHYLPVFGAKIQTEVPAAVIPHVAAPPAKSALKGRTARVLVAVALLLCVAGAGMWSVRRWSRAAVRPPGASSAIDRFWGPFFADNSSLVIYSNALFIGDSTHGLRYAPPGITSRPGRSDFVDTYTGIGELNSVYELTRLFDGHRATFTLKRSLLVTWDEARQRNLIFIGSVAENPALRVMPDNMDFTLKAGKGFSGIVNHNPRPGELALYSRPEHPLTRDYAIVALLPGLEPGRRILVFSGLMTLGTEAAVEFACRPDGLEQLLRTAAGPGGVIRPFEAVIETTVGGDVPLESKLIAIHVH